MDLNKPLQSQVYQYIKGKILAGEFDEDALYSETRLAKELCVSRTPLREALHYLEQDGYIVIVPSRGFRLRRLDREGLRESIEVRCAIEGYCIYRATERAGTPEGRKLLRRLEELLDEMERLLGQADRQAAFIDCDHAFHRLLIDFVRNTEFQTGMQRVYYLMRKTSEEALRVPGRAEATLEEHKQLFRAISAGDPLAAYQELLRHLSAPLALLEKN